MPLTSKNDVLYQDSVHAQREMNACSSDGSRHASVPACKTPVRVWERAYGGFPARMVYLKHDIYIYTA